MAQVILTVDLGFGDAGKGSMIDWLTRRHKASLVVRYNGGAQAAHNVITPDGRHHTFQQVGSGAFAGAETYLSRFMLLAPDNFLREVAHLEHVGVPNPPAQVFVDRKAPIITPFHRAANRIREYMRGGKRHGSCGEGIGETASDVLTHGEKMLYAGDLQDEQTLRRKLAFVRASKVLELTKVFGVRARDRDPGIDDYMAVFETPDAISRIVSTYRIFANRVTFVDESFLKNRLSENGTVLFEGAQGVLLDEWYGFHPYTTWSTTTLANADLLLAEARHTGHTTRLGILRAYATRHGAGPFPTEDQELTTRIPDLHNGVGDWQGSFRVGHLDTVLARYALKVVGGVDSLALTNLDRLPSVAKIAHAYDIERVRLSDLSHKTELADLAHQERLTKELEECMPVYTAYAKEQTVEAVEALLQTPVGVTSHGPSALEKRIRGTLACAA